MSSLQTLGRMESTVSGLSEQAGETEGDSKRLYTAPTARFKSTRRCQNQGCFSLCTAKPASGLLEPRRCYIQKTEALNEDKSGGLQGKTRPRCGSRGWRGVGVAKRDLQETLASLLIWVWSSSHNALLLLVGVHGMKWRSLQGCAETLDIKCKQYCGRARGCRSLGVFLLNYFTFVLNAVFLTNSSSLHTALTEPGQLPLCSHGAARLVWRSPGLPATFRTKSYGMSDGTQTLIMFFFLLGFSGTF